MMAYIIVGLFVIGGMILYCAFRGDLNNVKNKNGIIAAGIILILIATAWIFLTSPSGSRRCAICGTTKGLRQITAKTSSGKYDESWYCAEHYADAWQYYYGK